MNPYHYVRLKHFAELLQRHSPESTHVLAYRTGALVVFSYMQPHRYYHNLTHLDWCFRKFEEVPRCPNKDAVQLALWYHDVVYDPEMHDNEAHSARIMRMDAERLRLDEKIIEDAYRLIMATLHTSERGRPGDEKVMMDIDLSIFAADWKRILSYERGIRSEHVFVDDEAYIKGHTAILQSFLDRKRIFQSTRFYMNCERQARENLSRLIKHVKKPV